MRRFLGKFGFIHRRLWERDGFYRVALLFGPGPLAGAAVAAIAWRCVVAAHGFTYQPPPWAHYTPSAARDIGSADAPLPASPTRPLPPLRADGSVIGYDAGWNVTANALTVSPALETNVSPTPIIGFTLDAPTATMAQLQQAGPKDRLFAAIGTGFLVIRKAGTYGLFPRLERPAGPVADCLVRLVANGKRVMSELEVNVAQRTTRDFPPAWFAFQPGLYRIAWVFGCSKGSEMSNLGQISVMLREPGDPAPHPLLATDVVR